MFILHLPTILVQKAVHLLAFSQNSDSLPAMRSHGLLLGLGAVLALGSACVSKGKYEKAMADLKACQSRAETCEKNLADTEAKLARTEEDLQRQLAEERLKRESAEKLIADMETNLSTTKTELAELRKQRAEAERRLAAFKALTAKFQAMIDTGKIKVVFRGGRMIVELPAGILFASGRADLSKEGQAALTEVAAILREFPDRNFMVAGHTDNVPLRGSKFKDNWELSVARALTVTRFLIESGMDPKRLAPAGFAEHDPVGDNATEEGRQQNRRIEIILLPNLDELPKMPEG